jgi:branched-chain amino acid transport system permease protein
VSVGLVDLIAALHVGTLYGLLALSYFLINRTTGILNFAVGGYAMVGGVLFASLATEHAWPAVAAVGGGLVAAALVGVLTESVVIRPMARKRASEFSVVVALVASLFVIEQLVGMVFGRRTLVAPALANGTVNVGADSVGRHVLASIVMSVMVMVAVAWWVRYSADGRMLRAIGDNEDGAVGIGVAVPRLRLLVAAVAGAVAGVAGVLVAPQAGVSFESALTYSLAGFVALVIGGTGSPWAPLVGGLVVGFLEAYGAVVFGSASKDYLILGALVVIFALRPQGIFSMKVRAT